MLTFTGASYLKSIHTHRLEHRIRVLARKHRRDVNQSINGPQPIAQAYGMIRKLCKISIKLDLLSYDEYVEMVKMVNLDY